MSSYTPPQKLSTEGTISFRLTPIVNGTNRLYLLDFGVAKDKNRITLVVVKDTGGVRNLSLEIFNDLGKQSKISKPFPDFQIGLAFDVELVWSTKEHKVAVFINDDQFIGLDSEDVKFCDNLGTVIHYGEDINGENKTEMMAE